MFIHPKRSDFFNYLLVIIHYYCSMSIIMTKYLRTHFEVLTLQSLAARGWVQGREQTQQSHKSRKRDGEKTGKEKSVGDVTG